MVIHLFKTLMTAVLAVGLAAGCSVPGPPQPTTSTLSSSKHACEEVPYTLTARKGMATFSVAAGNAVADKLAGQNALPSLEAKVQFVRFELMSSGRQASKDVLEQYFCRVKEKYPAQLATLLVVESKLDEILDYTFDGKHFVSAESQIALDAWLKTEAVALLRVDKRPFAAEQRGELASVVGEHNFTKVTEASVELKAAIATYHLGACASALVASGASTVTSGLSNHLAALDGITLGLLTGTADEAQLARRIRDGAKVVYASTPEPDALAGLGDACAKEG